MSFDWDQAKTFLAVAEAGSLSKAAQVLGQTQPTVSRRVAGLEAALNATLFERTKRSITLTPFGVELLDHVRTMAHGADMVSLAALGQSQTVEGQVRITASEVMSAFVLPPILSAISEEAPKLALDVVADNDPRDLVRREADIAIRHAAPEQPNLIAKRLADDSMRFYATKAYLERVGPPALTNVSDHQIISYVGAERMLGYLRPAGLDLRAENFRFTTTSQLVALELACRGMGLIIMSERVARHHVDLVPTLSELGPFQVPTWLVTHSELKTARRIRLVFDHISTALA